MTQHKSCSVCGDFKGSRWLSWSGGWFHSDANDCIINLRAALAHEQDRARRVVRVFWRIEGWDGCCYIRRDAIAIAKERHGGHWLMCIRRVTARRVAKAGKVSA